MNDRLTRFFLLALVTALVGGLYASRSSILTSFEGLTWSRAPAARAEAYFEGRQYDQALAIYRTLAAQGNAEAELRLGHMYDLGLGVAKDESTAVHWIRAAANKGFVPAEQRLGEMYLEGSPVLQDFALARTWLERAARDGNTRAQRELGSMYEKGLGMAKDPISAYVWYDIAASRGDAQARRLRDHTLEAMSTDQIDQAQRRAKRVAESIPGGVTPGAPRRDVGPAVPGSNEAASHAAGG